MRADQLVAHRGYQKCYPENSLIAYRKAIEAGALFVETDIQLTADGVPVLYHDQQMKRLSGYDGRIDELTVEQLNQLPLSEPGRFGERFNTEPIATLDQFVVLLQQYPQVTAFVELKEEALLRFGVNSVAQILSHLRPAIQQTVVISFDYRAIELARFLGVTQVGVVLKRWRDQYLPMVQNLRPEYLFCDARKIPIGADLRQCSGRMVIYEVARRDQARRWLERGAHQVESFDIVHLMEGHDD